MLAEIRARHERGRSLAATSAPPALVSSAIARFTSWAAAIAAAGIDYATVRRKVGRHDDSELLDRWRTLAREQPEMRLVELRRQSWVSAAIARFGSWRAVGERAGVAGWPRVDKPPWSRERIVVEMRALAAQGLPVSADENLYLAAKRHFGSLDAAAKAAGVKVRQPRGRSEHEVLTALRAIARDHGMVTSALAAEAGVRAAAMRQFGSLTAACSAAGVDGYRQHHARARVEQYSREAVLEALRQAAGTGRAVTRRKLSWSVHQAVLRHFGRLSTARAAAGLAPLVPRARTWTQERVVAELRREHRRGTRLTHAGLVEAGRGDLFSALSALIGSMPRARQIARVPDPIRPPRTRRAFEQYWDEEVVLEEVRALAAAGHSLASSKAPRALVAAGGRYFGNWRAAIEAAGFDYDAVLLRRDYTDEELLAALRVLHASRPDLALAEFHAMPISTSLYRRFGTLEQAAELAGVDDWPARASHRVLSLRAVRDALRTRLAAGQPINRAAIRAADPQLCFSVVRIHPVWPEALAKLGLLDKRVDRHWDRETVVAALAGRARARRSLAEAQVEAADPELHEAATRWFGSFTAAVSAADEAGRQRRG